MSQQTQNSTGVQPKQFHMTWDKFSDSSNHWLKPVLIFLKINYYQVSLAVLANFLYGVLIGANYYTFLFLIIYRNGVGFSNLIKNLCLYILPYLDI